MKQYFNSHGLAADGVYSDVDYSAAVDRADEDLISNLLLHEPALTSEGALVEGGGVAEHSDYGSIGGWAGAKLNANDVADL